MQISFVHINTTLAKLDPTFPTKSTIQHPQFSYPSQNKKITIKHQFHWHTEETRDAKKQCRKAERRWRLTKLTVNLEIYHAECLKVSNMCKEAKQNYYCLKIEECGKYQTKVFSITTELMNNSSSIIRRPTRAF